MPSPRSRLAALVAVFIALLLASPQARAAVMPNDAEADARTVVGDDDHPSLAGRDVADLPLVMLAISRHPPHTPLPPTASSSRATHVDLDGASARGPP